MSVNIKIVEVKKIIKNKEDTIELISTRDRILSNILLKIINNKNQ